jgi:hypothetical protein
MSRIHTVVRAIFVGVTLIHFNIGLGCQEGKIHSIRQAPSLLALSKAASTFCRAIGWDLKRSHPRSEAVGLPTDRWFLFTSDGLFVVSTATMSVVVAENRAYAKQRRQLPRDFKPYLARDTDWFDHGKKMAAKVWGELALRPIQCKRIGAGATNILSNDARTVFLRFAILSPVAASGGEVTMTLDLDQGKVIRIARWNKPRS